MSRLLLLAAFAVVAVHAAPTYKSYVEVPDYAATNASAYSINTFAPKIFLKTDEFDLNYTQCVQYSFKLLEKKVRLRAYTCQLGEGGFCVLDKYSFPTHKIGCAYLRPWTFDQNTYSFYFVLERRVRKYGKNRVLRGRRVAKRSGTVMNQNLGSLQIDGIMPCRQVCDGAIFPQANRLD